MNNFINFIDKSNLSLKNEICFSSVIHTVMTSIVLNHTLEENNHYATAQASLFKVSQDSMCEQALNNLWIRDKKGFELNEYVENVTELFSWVRLALDHMEDEDLFNYIQSVKNYMKEVKVDK